MFGQVTWWREQTLLPFHNADLNNRLPKIWLVAPSDAYDLGKHTTHDKGTSDPEGMYLN